MVYGPEQVFAKFGVYPENIVGYLALMGDNADNVIGIDNCCCHIIPLINDMILLFHIIVKQIRPLGLIC